MHTAWKSLVCLAVGAVALGACHDQPQEEGAVESDGSGGSGGMSPANQNVPHEDAAIESGGGSGGSGDAMPPPGQDARQEDSASESGGSDVTSPPGQAIQTVFVVLEENHDWTSIKSLPYFKHLIATGAHSEQYYNPKALHPSEPNYIWIEAGKNFCLTSTSPCQTDDSDPTKRLVHGANHLTKLLDAAGVSWMSYQEDATAGECPITSAGAYAAKHDPFVFFDDVVGNPPKKTNPYCIAHHKPASQLLADIKAGTVARYNFITPNLNHDMHDGTLQQGDDWLKANLDPLINPSSQYYNAALYAHAAVFITWDEGEGGSDGPIGLIAVSPFAKVGYQDTSTPKPYYYTHSSLLLTLQRIFGVASTPLEGAANAHDLADLFTTFP